MVGGSGIALAAALAIGAAQGAAPGSRQAVYDAAQAAYERSDWAAAAQGFGAVLPSDPGKRLSPAEAEIAARRGDALLRLGRYVEAREAEDRALAGLPDRDGVAVADALIIAGDAARFSAEFRAAADYHRRAYALAVKGHERNLALRALAGLATAAATSDPVEVGKLLDAALADRQMLAGIDKKTIAVLEDLRGRAALNAGDVAAARRWTKRAVDDSGGLVLQLNLNQLAARADAGIAAARAGSEEDTRQYLAYTGAGHLPDLNWIGHFSGDLPVCSTLPDGAGPDDSVIVQFAIAADGQVDTVLPIYASRPGAFGESFAQSVVAWRWDAGSLAKVEPFWRNSLVLELRCETRPKPDGLGKQFRDRASEWVRSASAKEAANPLFGSDDIHFIAALLNAPEAWRPGDAEHLDTLLDRYHAPPDVYAVKLMGEVTNRTHGIGTSEGYRRALAAQLTTRVPAFVTRFPNTAAGGWLTLEWALALEDLLQFDRAKPLLASVLVLPEGTLPAESPVRRVALLHASLVATRLGEPDAARNYLASSGLTAEQCSLFDTHPVAASTQIGSSSFPVEAMRWGFEGYVREAFDIADDGRVANIRTVVAYPPFVFASATEKAIARWRYVPPMLDGKSIGCTGKTQNVNFRLPH